MWDKEASQIKKPEDTSVEGNTENATSQYFKTNNLTENVSARADKVVVATYVVRDDDDCASNRKNVNDGPKSLAAEQSDIDSFLPIVQLCDGPSTSSFSKKKELPTSAVAIAAAAKEITFAEDSIVSFDNNELPYKNINADTKTLSSMQSNRPVIPLKYDSPIARKSAENIQVQNDNVAGPQIQTFYDKQLTLQAEDLHAPTREYSPAVSVEDLTSVSEMRAGSPTPSSITSASTLRAARGMSGRRTDCLRHMRRPPKEPEEYLDALFPHIRKTHMQIRQALLHTPLTDVKDNALLKKKMLELIQIYTCGCRDEFERVGPSLVLCRRLKRNIIRLLDLFHEICSSSREDRAYLYHISQLIAVYTSLEIRLSFNLTRQQKCALIHRISHIINKHLMVKNEPLAKENILRMFLHMPDTYSARFIMEPLFNTYLVEIATSSNTWCQKEMPDKLFVQYIIILHIWKEMLRDPLEQVELINRAQHFMCPTKTLHANPMYANHLPTIHTRKHAVKDILNSLKFFHDLRNAAICDDTLNDGEDDIAVVIDEVINTPFWDFGATYTGASKQPKSLYRRIPAADQTECVDLTQEDDQQSIFDSADKPLEWLTKLKEHAAERVQVDESEKVICLDSDSDGELFSGSILDPSESYQDCDAFDTDYTSLDGGTSDDKELSEDEALSANGITPNCLRTYLAPRTKNQIRSEPYERTRDCDGEGDSAAVGSKKSAAVSTAEPTVPLIVNSFTVRGKQNMHLLNSPRFSLDIGPERFGNEDIEFHDACDEMSLNFKATKNYNKRADSAVVNDGAAGRSVGGYYRKEVNTDDEEEDDEYQSLPSTASSSTTTLGKVIFSQALQRPSQQFFTGYERANSHKRADSKEKTVTFNERNKADSKKQMHGQDKPVKKQVKFNDNPIGPTRRPHTKLPIKPAIHLSKIQPSSRQPIFSSSPQPRFSSPSSSTSSTSESLKQMAQKGRNFVDIIKTCKYTKISKSSSTIILDSDDDDDIIDINVSANKNTNLVSTQPIQSKNTYEKSISFCNSNMSKMQACDVLNSTTMKLGPKDISSTNKLRNKSVDIMHISGDESRDNTASIVDNNVRGLEKQLEREEQNSNVSTTTGPNVDSSTGEDDNSIGLVNEKCSEKQAIANVESTSKEEDYRAHSLELITGSDICTSTSTETYVQSTECSVQNFKSVQYTTTQSSSNADAGGVVGSVMLVANIIGNENVDTAEENADKLLDIEAELNMSVTHVDDFTDENTLKTVICENKSGLEEKNNCFAQTAVLSQYLVRQNPNKVDENVYATENSDNKASNQEETVFTETLQSDIATCTESWEPVNEQILENNFDVAEKSLSNTEKINEDKNCTDSITPETNTRIEESCNNQSKEYEFEETLDTKESLDNNSQETQSQVARDNLAVHITETKEYVVDTAEIPEDVAAISNIVPTTKIATTEESLLLTEGQVVEELLLFEAGRNTTETNVIIQDILRQESENKILEEIVTSVVEHDVQERATHSSAENEIPVATNIYHVEDMEIDSVTNEMTAINADATAIIIDESTIRETLMTANVSENNIPTYSGGKSNYTVSAVFEECMAGSNENKSDLKTPCTEAEQNISFNIHLENTSMGQVDKEKVTSNEIEHRECLEIAPKSVDANVDMVQTEKMVVPNDIFKPTIAKNDGLACLVAAVKSVEALTFTTQVSEYIVPAERETRDGNENTGDAKNLLPPYTNLTTLSEALVTPKTNANVTEQVIDRLDNSLRTSDTCILVKPKTTESNSIYFSGDGPKTNLERLAEAAVQKYGEHVADREIVEHIKTKCKESAFETSSAENIKIKSDVMLRSQTGIINNAIETDSANAVFRAKSQADKHQKVSRKQLETTAVTVDNIQVSQTIDYDMQIFNLRDNVQHIQDSAKSAATCNLKIVNISKSSQDTKKSGNSDNVSFVSKSPKPGSTFLSHFESFISTLKDKQGTKYEVKEQRRSPRTPKPTTTKIPSTSESAKSVVVNTKAQNQNIVKNLHKNTSDLVITNKVSVGAPTQHSPKESTSSDSELSNVGVGVGESSFRKRYSLRKPEQWKVIRNTSLRASPPESIDTIKPVNNTRTKRCIKIRLARAKVPTKVEKKEPPVSTAQNELNLETEFGDVSHRPITRRLAAALNSSLQMITENAVIEPIKPFARGRKSKSKVHAALAQNTPTKRRKCENIVSEKVLEPKSCKEPAFSNKEIYDLKELRKHCALELSPKSHSEPPVVAKILQNKQLDDFEMLSVEPTCFPEERSAKRMKIEKRENVAKNSGNETVTTAQNAESDPFTFETVFVKPTLVLKNLKPVNLSSAKEINKLQQQTIEESETVKSINKRYPKRNQVALNHNSTVKAVVQKEKLEDEKIQEKAKLKYSENSIESNCAALKEESALTNDGKQSLPANDKITVEDPKRLYDQGLQLTDNRMKPDNAVIMDKIPIANDVNLTVSIKNSNETSGEVLSQKSCLTQNKDLAEKTVNKSYPAFRESELKTQADIIPRGGSHRSSESEAASVLDCIKTIDLEKVNLERTDETEVFTRDSVSNTQEVVKHFNGSSSICATKETSALVSGEDMRNLMKTSNLDKTLTTDKTSVVDEDVNKICAERRAYIEDSVLNRQDVVTLLDESAFRADFQDPSVLDLNEGKPIKTIDSENSFKTESDADKSAPILEKVLIEGNTERTAFIGDQTEEHATQVAENSSAADFKETRALLSVEEMSKEFIKTNDSNQIGNRIKLNTVQSPSKQVILTNELTSAPIIFNEDSAILPENNEAPPLVDISNFTSLTLDTKSDVNFQDVAEFMEKDSNINLSISQITDRNEYLNESDSINTLKTNMEADKLLEEYNHSVRIIANANLKIPSAIHTPTDVCTPPCSSVTFSFTASDSSSSFANSCSCSTTATVNSATDLYKNEPTSFKVVQSQAQVVELLSTTSTSFQDLSLLDLEHDVIMGNDDLLSELIPTTMMDTATSLEHNYATKPLETSIRNEYDIPNEVSGDTEVLPKTNSDIQYPAPSLKVSIPIARIKRFDEIMGIHSKNWYLSEKPTTSKAALAALARRNAKFKTDVGHIFSTSSIPRHKQISESKFSESVGNKQNVATTDSIVSQHLLACESFSPSPSLPLKKRRNISGVLEEDFCNAAVILSEHSDLMTMISQGSNSYEPNKLANMATEAHRNKNIEFNNTKNVESQTITDIQVRDYQSNTNYIEEYRSDKPKNTNETMQSVETDFENKTRVESTFKQQIEENALKEEQNAFLSNKLKEIVINTRTNEVLQATNENSFNNQTDINNSNKPETIAEQQTMMEIADSLYKKNRDVVFESKQHTRDDIDKNLIPSSEQNTDVKDASRDQDMVQQQQKEVILQLGTEIQTFENSISDQSEFVDNTLRRYQKDPTANDISTIGQNITEERALLEKPNDQAINIMSQEAENITETAAVLVEKPDQALNNEPKQPKNLTAGRALLEDRNDTPIKAPSIKDERATLEDQQDVVNLNTETDGAVTNMQFQETIEQKHNTQALTNEQQMGEHIMTTIQEQLHDIEVPPVQHILVPDHQGLTLNEDHHTDHTKNVTATDLSAGPKNITTSEIKEKVIKDLMSFQHSNDNFNDNANEAMLSNYDDQFLVTVCLNDADTVSGFETTDTLFATKEYAENNFNISNDDIISTQDIKQESKEFINDFSPPKSPINLTKPPPISNSAYDFNTSLLNQNEFVEFTSDPPHSVAPTNSNNYQLYSGTIPNNGLVATDMNVNNIPTFTNCEINIDQAEPSDRKSIIDLAQIDELNFGEQDSMHAAHLQVAGEQMNQLEYDNFTQPQIHTATTDSGMTSPLKISSNIAATKPTQTTETGHETQATVVPTIKICSTNKSKQSLENNEIIAMPTNTQSQQLTKPATLSPILPLIKPSTTTIETIYDKPNAIFSFPDIEPTSAATTLAPHSVAPQNFPITTTASTTDNCATTTSTNDEKSFTTCPSLSSLTQTQTTHSNTARVRAPARVQIVTPQRKRREIAPKTSEEPKTPNITLTNTTANFCTTVEFDMHQGAATIPVSYTTTPARYANLCQFEKYLQKLMTLIDVPAIIDSARNLFVDKQALAEAHAALLAQATQSDDDGNAISEPLLMKYHKDGTISILNDNDECIILTASMSKMVKSLSLALSILQEQESPVLGIRARIHALLKQLTQTSTTKCAHVAPNVNNSTIIPTAVVNPTNLIDTSHDIEINAPHAMEYCSDIGETVVSQQVPPPLQVINANFQNLQLYAGNWQHVEDSGLITSIPNTELQITNIDALPFAADAGATNYENAIAFNFDEHATILATNENTNAQRFENAFQTTLESAGGRNAEGDQNKIVSWSHEKPSDKVTQPLNCTEVVYEQNVTQSHEHGATGRLDVTNDNLHTVIIDEIAANGSYNRGDTVIESYAMPTFKTHAIATVDSNLVAAVSPKSEKSKKIQRKNDNYQHVHTQPNVKPNANSSTKKMASKRVEKVSKALCGNLAATVAVPPQSHTQNTSNSKVSHVQHSSTPIHSHSSTIHYRHTPHSVTVECKPTTTLHYKQSTPCQQQQPQPIASLQASSQANHVPQPIPHISIDSVSNTPLFSQQYAQNSMLSGGVGLFHNHNNIRYILTTPHTRTHFAPASTTLSNCAIIPLNTTPETPVQYPYQLHTLQAPPNFSDNLKLNELELQAIIKNSEVVASRATTAAVAPTTTTSTTKLLRSFRNVPRANALSKTVVTPTYMLNNDAQITNEGMSITMQQPQHQQHTPQQSIHLLEPASTLIIGDIQHNQEAEFDCLRQETPLQTVLQEPQAQQQSQNQRVYTTLTPILPVQAEHQYNDEREKALLTQQQQRPPTPMPILKPSHIKAPTSPNTPASNVTVNRKRGRPRKYNLGENTSACDATQKHAKLSECPKIRPNAAASPNASARNKLQSNKSTNAKVRQILPATHHTLTNESHDLATPQPTPLPPPPPLTKLSPSCSPHELRPSIASSANFIENMANAVESNSSQSVRPTATVGQQQQQHLSQFHMPDLQTTNDSQNNHINAIATLFSSYKISKPTPASGAAARNSGSNTTQLNKPKYKAGPKSMHMSRKTTAMSETSKYSMNSPRSICNSQSPTKSPRSHSTSPASLRASSPVIIAPETAADPKLNKKCVVLMKENEEVIKYKRQQVAFINELLEKQREMQRQRALKRQEFQNILNQKRKEGKRLKAEISQIKKQQTAAHETVLDTELHQPQQSPTILNRKRLLVRERNVTFKTNTKVRSRSTTPNRSNDEETSAKDIDTTSAAIMQSVIGDTFELAAEAMPLSDEANRTSVALKNINVAPVLDKKSTTSVRSTTGVANAEPNTLTNTPKSRVPSTSSRSKAIKTNIAAISTQTKESLPKAEELTGMEISGAVVPTTSKTSFKEKPKIPAPLALATTPPYTRCARSMTPTRGAYNMTKQSEMHTERTTDNLLINCSSPLSTPTSSKTRLQRAPSLSPSIFMNRNRVEVRRSMQDPTSNTDFPTTGLPSWLLNVSPRSFTKTLKVRLKRLQHSSTNSTSEKSPEKETSDRISMPTSAKPTLLKERVANATYTVANALIENTGTATPESQIENNKHERVQLLKQKLKKELYEMGESFVRPVDTKDKNIHLKSAKDIAYNQGTQTAEGRISKGSRRKHTKKTQQSNKKLKVLKVNIEKHTNKVQSDLRTNESPCDNAADCDSKNAKPAKADVEDGLQCDRTEETKELVGFTLAIDNNELCHKGSTLPIESSELLADKMRGLHSENTAKQKQFSPEPSKNDKHASKDVKIINERKGPNSNNSMNVDCDNVNNKKHKRTHKHGAIVTQVVDVTPGRHVKDNLLNDLLLVAATNQSTVLNANNVLNTASNLAIIEPPAAELPLLGKVVESSAKRSVGPAAFDKSNNLMPEGINDKTHIEISEEMAVAVSGLTMLANRPITTANSETCKNTTEFRLENVDLILPKKTSNESISSDLQCMAEPTIAIGLINDTQSHAMTSVDAYAAIDEQKKRVVETSNDIIVKPNDTGGVSGGEESNSDCLLLQLSKRVHKMSDLESIVDATTVHVIKDATMTLMSFEATPTLPAYLLNGESRDVPTPPAISTPAPTPAPTPTADLAPEAEQPKSAPISIPTPALPEIMIKENAHAPSPIDLIIRDEFTKPNDSTEATVSVKVSQPAQKHMISLADAPLQAQQEPIVIGEGLSNNSLSPPQEQQLEVEANSPAPASAISTSDHEVSSTQEIVYTPTKRSNANTLNTTAGMSIPLPNEEEAAMWVQNSQIDTTHHLTESSYYMRKRARKFSDEFTLPENKNESSAKDIIKQRRKTFSSESSLAIQFPSNATSFTKNIRELTNSSATAGAGSGINNGGQNSGGSSPSTTTEPTAKHAPPRRRNHIQKRNNSQSPLTARSRAGSSIGELNSSFVYSCSRLQPTNVDMVDVERCVVLPASAVVPPVNLGNISRTYSKNNMSQIKVFVPPDVEMCLEKEDTEKDAFIATTTSKRGRPKGSVKNRSRKEPKLESPEKVKAKKAAANLTKTKAMQSKNKRDNADSRPKLIDCSSKSTTTKAPTRTKHVERAPNRKRK